MIYLYFLLGGVVGLRLLWIYYLAVMTLKVARDNGTLAKDKDAYYIGMSALYEGWVIDFIKRRDTLEDERATRALAEIQKLQFQVIGLHRDRNELLRALHRIATTDTDHENHRRWAREAIAKTERP